MHWGHDDELANCFRTYVENFAGVYKQLPTLSFYWKRRAKGDVREILRCVLDIATFNRGAESAHTCSQPLARDTCESQA